MLKTRDLTVGALCSCMCILFLFISSVIPTGKLAVAFIATLMPAVACTECEKKITSLVCGIASGIIAAFFIPKSGLSAVVTVLFCGCFCYYPWLKYMIERVNNIAVEWIIKAAFFIVVSIILKLISLKIGIKIYNVIIQIFVFAAYDILVSYMMSYYVSKISPKIRKSRMK